MVADVVTARVDVFGPALRSSAVGPLKLVVSSVGTFVAARVTVPVNPFFGVTVTVLVAVALAVSVSVDGSAEVSMSAVEVQVLASVTACPDLGA